jgi:hypothetical protein
MSVTGEAGTQACPKCGAGFPAWSMFCTQCGAQTDDSRPGSQAASAMVAAAPQHRQTNGNRIVRTQSNTHGTYALVWAAIGFFSCFILWFPAFSQAKKSRLKGESIAATATNVTQIGFVVWIVLQILGVVLFFWLASQPGFGEPSGTTLPLRP